MNTFVYIRGLITELGLTLGRFPAFYHTREEDHYRTAKACGAPEKTHLGWVKGILP